MRHVSSIVRIDEEDDVDGGGSTAVVGSANCLVEGSPEEGPLDASPIEDSTQGRLELAFAALCLRNVAPIWAMIWIGSDAGKSSKPKSNRIYEWKPGKTNHVT